MKAFVRFSLIFIAIWGSGCSLSVGSSQKEALLVVGLSADNPPFEFKKNGEIVGLDVDIAREVAQDMGLSLSVQDMDFSALIPAVQTGRLDLAVAGITVTPERKKNMDFSDPYFENTFALVLMKESSFNKEEDFRGKKVGVQLGTTMEKFAMEKAKVYAPMEVVALGRNSILIQELKAGRFFAVLTESNQASAFVAANPALKTIPLSGAKVEYAAVFPKAGKVEDPRHLKSKFNASLAKLKKSGKIDEIRSKWIGK